MTERRVVERAPDVVDRMPGPRKAVLFVYHGIFDGFNRRLQREFRTFQKLGVDVRLLTCQSEDFNPSYLPDNVSIIPVQWHKFRISLRGEWIWNPVWYMHIRRAVNLVRPGLILVREFFHVPVARLAAPRRIPVVLDMAENVPALRRVSHKTPFSLSRIIMWPARASRAEKLACRMADHILVVIDEQKERLTGVGLSPEKVTVIRSTPILEAMAPDADWGAGIEIPKGYPVVSFVGGSGPHRGIDVLLRAVPKVTQTFPEAQFVIVGDHLGRESYLSGLIQKLDIQENVYLPGKVSYGQALRYMQHCDMGVIPHRNNPHINTTVPNKLFDYMFFGKPLVVSDARPLARVVNEVGCGYVYPDPDADRLADAIVSLAKNAHRNEIGLRGRKAVLERYNWSVEESRLVDLIGKLIV